MADREEEFMQRLREIVGAYQDVIAPIRSALLMAVALALADGFKANCGAGDSATEDEFVSLAKRVHQRVRRPAGSGN
jgi:DnaJ-domain-containing protein 1